MGYCNIRFNSFYLELAFKADIIFYLNFLYYLCGAYYSSFVELKFKKTGINVKLKL